MDKAIRNICRVLQAEAEAVKTYTECMKQATDADAERTFAMNRLDSMDHIQSLTIELTKLVSGTVNDELMDGEAHE